MTDGKGSRWTVSRWTGAGVAALAVLLLSACATSDPAPPPVADPPPAAAPTPHALAEVPDFRSVPASQPEPRPSSAPALEFVKADEAAISGIVVGPGGEPLDGALILLQTDVTNPMPRAVRACTGADGRFRVAAPRERPVVLRVVTPTSPPHGFRHPVERIEVPAGGAADLVVRLRTGQTIAGRVVTGDDDPVGGLRLVTVVPSAMSGGAYVAAETVTSANGSFSFDGLAAGFHTIAEERRDGAVRDHVLLDVSLVPTGTTTLVVRRLPVGVVTGRVRDGEGRLAASRTVVLARKGAALIVETQTDAAGFFRASVAVPGAYVVRIRVATQSGHTDLDMGEIEAPAAAGRLFVAPR